MAAAMVGRRAPSRVPSTAVCGEWREGCEGEGRVSLLRKLMGL